MASAVRLTDNLPLSDLNTTPLIDVLLVLLILFVITIPPATNTLDVPLPPPSSAPLPPVVPEHNRVSITASGAILWNGAAVNESQLFALLTSTTRLKPEPELRFQPDSSAPYETSLRVMSLVKNSGVTAFGFVGNETFAGFGKAPDGINPIVGH